MYNSSKVTALNIVLTMNILYICTVFPCAELAEILKKEGVKIFSLDAAKGHNSKIFDSFYEAMKVFNPIIIDAHWYCRP